MDARPIQYSASSPVRPQLPQLSEPSSSTSSAFQSSSSLSSITSSASQLSMPDQHSPSFSSAPLPSPSQTHQAQYFGALPARQQSQTSQPPHPQRQDSVFQGQRGVGGAPETAPFLKDFNLLAEAAKRAQMACMMRDFGDVEL